MKGPLPIPLEDLTPDERADERLVRLVERLALERRVRARYLDLLPRWGWLNAIADIADEENARLERELGRPLTKKEKLTPRAVRTMVWGG